MTDPARTPASFYLQEAVAAAPQPAGMAPGGGQFVLPQVQSFIGVQSTLSQTYRYSDEALRHSLDNARYMRNDLSIRECLDHRGRSTSLLNWHLEPENANDPALAAVAAELTKVLRRIPRFMQLREWLLGNGLWCGKTAVQLKYGWQFIDGQRRLCVNGWKPVHGDKLVHRIDSAEHPDQIGIRIGLSAVGGREWITSAERLKQVEPTDYGMAYFLSADERRQLIVHMHQMEDGEYEEPLHAGRLHGVGIRSVIYWTWYQAQETLAFLMDHLERTVTGLELWYYPAGNDKARDDMAAAAQNRIGEGRNILMIPRQPGEEGMGYGVERIEVSSAGAETLKGVIIDLFGARIKRYILGQTLTTEASATGLGSNLASIHLDTYLQIVRYDATNLEETITEDLIKHLVRWNFPQHSSSRIVFKIDTESADVEGKLAAYFQAYQMGLKIRSQDVRDMLGAVAPTPDEETLQQSPAEAGPTAVDPQQPLPGGVGAGLVDQAGQPLMPQQYARQQELVRRFAAAWARRAAIPQPRNRVPSAASRPAGPAKVVRQGRGMLAVL